MFEMWCARCGHQTTVANPQPERNAVKLSQIVTSIITPILLVVLIVVVVIVLLSKPKYQNPREQAVEMYNNALATTSSAEFELTTNAYDNEKVNAVKKANRKIAEYNILRDNLSEREQEGLPALPYIKLEQKGKQ